ncbi:purine nucleosidase [Pseudoduganella flava]|uniref:Nucleoside hydrolase n=1 Tax=Pseudoduganella flava TaxID=871742 RepID=A0A562PDK0_9BURK|nr:nucleoside hydrolase [Pseudoduganella flava]QGZ42115.1 nucleoside hydrolase [Pseudoduganella flava]TWI42514.1 purine nucleosidase [Pseudoduganella flava]
MKHKVIIDCDPGIDDALALLLAAGLPDLDLLAVTTVAGNRPADITAINARRILDLAGRHDVPVHAGAARPLGHADARCNLVHGEDGLGGVVLPQSGQVAPEHSALRLVQLLAEHPPGTVELVATGPLTNLALCEALAPGSLARARHVLVMGGALRVPGNITPAAEFNFYSDPVSAQMVLDAGANLLLFPLDVTSQAVMHPEWIAAFGAADNACGRAAGEMLAAYAELDPLLHDACPVAWLADPELFSGQRCHAAVDWRDGPTAGHVRAWFGERDDAPGPANMQALLAVRNDELLALVAAAIARLP